MNSKLSATLQSQIRNRASKLAGNNIRKYLQPTWAEFATTEIYHLARRLAGVQFPESSDNHPIRSEKSSDGPRESTDNVPTNA